MKISKNNLAKKLTNTAIGGFVKVLKISEKVLLYLHRTKVIKKGNVATSINNEI